MKSVDLIAAEDTRHTKILLDALCNIQPQPRVFLSTTKSAKPKIILQALQQGQNVALVTDAGTPGISDPGYYLIRLAQEQHIPVTVIPGATAAIAALTASGLPSHNFIFEGFLPVKSAARRKKLESFRNEERTVIFYESPHRLVKALEDIREVLQDPTVVVARELTKKFEEIKSAPASEQVRFFSAHAPKGEFVLLLNLAGQKVKKTKGQT